ncbi:tRNA(Ile2) C34 agmatinyltransferase TiaS [Bradyrhizobium ottawaense]|uniref:tRNA(Ile2) C34 agmatinyltransferase TiaS n=1 Tax=Bradyrhizobium ottawaense TaxID=931866 RepID=A0ABV4G2H5_9BRAD
MCRQRSACMTCPRCAKPMMATSANSFRCEPCREIVIVFAVVSKFLPPKIVPTASHAAEEVASRAFIDR